MSTNSNSIFEAVLDPEKETADPPASTAPPSPFKQVDEPDEGNTDEKPNKISPFTVVDDAEPQETKQIRPAKLPEKRKPRSPFQVAEGVDGAGMFPQGQPASQFQAAYPNPGMPYPPMPMDPSAGFGGAFPTYPSMYPPQGVMAQQPPVDLLGSRQLELRAIFEVDRPMSMDEILQHCRELDGVNNLTFLSGREASAVDAFFHVFQRLGLAGAELRVQAGEKPLELIREGPVILVVETSGDFEAGVRETLTIVAREIAKMM